MPIVRDNYDRWRFLKILNYFNDSHTPTDWERDLKIANGKTIFDRPAHWKPRSPLVKIMAFCLMDNHFHLLLKEITDGGIALFMQKIGNSMTGHFNKKYKATGSLFQGAYRAKVVNDDKYLRYLIAYILVKNPFELFPGKTENGIKNFEEKFNFASQYPFCSLGHLLKIKYFPFIELDIAEELFLNPEQFKNFARDVIEGRIKVEV